MKKALQAAAYNRINAVAEPSHQRAELSDCITTLILRSKFL